jgi:hypothetical protein
MENRTMKSILVSALALVIVALFVNVNAAQAGTASGSVVTCPAGDPLPTAGVWIYINDSIVDTVYADSNGDWSWDMSGASSGDILTACFPNGIHEPYTDPYCPLGRHGSPPNCCEQVVGTVPSHGNLNLDDLELRCGQPGLPCPNPN